MEKKEKLLKQKFNYGTVISHLGKTNRNKRHELLWEVLCDCGKTYSATTYELTSCRKKSCGCHKKYQRSKKLNNNIGQKFGKLTVIDIDGTKNNSGKLYRKCKCSCGEEKYITISQLKAGVGLDCGCNKNTRGRNHPLWRGFEDISKKYWSSIKHNAEKRGLDFHITIEDAWSQWLFQKRVCALTKQPLIFKRSKNNNWTASLDRIDNTKGYYINNIQWIHKDINKMKTDFNQDKFIELCASVYLANSV